MKQVVAVALLILAILLGAVPAQATDASIYFSPSGGQYTVGSTVDVSIVVNTGSHTINAVNTEISFPSDKLQVVSPSVGPSFVSIWTAPPSYSNTQGSLSFSGGLPNPGLKSSSAVLATVRFRVKSLGTAPLSFSNTTKVLANDGDGTNVLSSKVPANLNLVAAAPNGPVVSSTTHPDQNTWYNDRTAVFSWDKIVGATGYSYKVDGSSKTSPDRKVDTTKNEAIVEVDQDGIWYFHVRANNGSWGGTTHFLFKVDSQTPAQFTPKLNRSSVSDQESAIVSFFTTDAASGIDHYEVKSVNTTNNNEAVTLYHEEQSPFELPILPKGEYTVFVRAYDVAGNYTEGSVNLSVKQDLFPVITALRRVFTDPAHNLATIINLSLLLLLIIAVIILTLRRHKKRVAEALNTMPPAYAPTMPVQQPVNHDINPPAGQSH